MPTNVRLPGRFPVAWDLVGPWDDVLAILRQDGKDVSGLNVKIQIAKQQAVELNKILQAIGDSQQDSLIDLAEILARLDALEAEEATVTPAASSGRATYSLPIVGPDISISGTAFVAITNPVTIPVQHASSTAFGFFLESGNSAVNVLWQLVNATSGLVLLSGTLAAPVTRQLVLSVDPAPAMPLPGDEVALEVCFSGAGTGGEIQLIGPASWMAS